MSPSSEKRRPRKSTAQKHVLLKMLSKSFSLLCGTFGFFFFFAPHDVTFDSLLVVDSIQDGPCSDEVLEAFEHEHYPDCHVSLL